jgi:rRNA-processing protein FCF1
MRRKQLEQEVMAIGEGILRTMVCEFVLRELYSAEHFHDQQLALQTAIACIDNMVIGCCEVSSEAKELYRSILGAAIFSWGTVECIVRDHQACDFFNVGFGVLTKPIERVA